MREAEWITTHSKLEELTTELLRHDSVALDTEFFWERTFYPILGLVQLATSDGRCWLIDTVRLTSLKALAPILASSIITKVFHDAPQDLAILARATGVIPQKIFDTRLAAGFAGFSATSSLQFLLKEVFDITLLKTETRSDWLRRPLSTCQLRYATEDVLHLLPLKDALWARCINDSVREWLTEELASLDQPDRCQDRNPRAMYQRVKGSARLDARHLAILRELAAWRETEARQRDWPRAHVLPDDILVALARQAPLDAQALVIILNMSQSMPVEVLSGLLEAIKRGISLPDAECPQQNQHDFATKKAVQSQSGKLLTHIRAVCKTYEIDPALVASRTDVETFLQQHTVDVAQTSLLQQGWRKNIIASFSA